jgi:regulator of nucleoside diphosphate kinase
MSDHRSDDTSKGAGWAGLPRRIIRSIAAGLDDLPPVLLTSNDLRRLRALVTQARHETDESVLHFLVRELDRAVVCQPELIPADVVTMNSRVFFRRHIGQPIESRTLVYDGDHAVLGGAIPILAPLGVALLGLRDGSEMPYLSLQGVRYIARVERVAYQPEGDGRLLRAPWRYWPRPKVAGSDAERATPALRPKEGESVVIPLRPKSQRQPRPPRPTDDGEDPGPNSAA